MDILQVSLILMAVIFGFVLCWALIKKKEVIVEKIIKEEIKPPNLRDNYRLRVNVEDSTLEVIKIGNSEVNNNEVCEVVDVSAGGVGIHCEVDYPLRKRVLVKIHFKLNNKEFSLDGKLVRKIEDINKRKIFYGVEFIDLTLSDENKLVKEIFAIDNHRRMLSVK
jgi:c-di-GMP-binding flagellar brake protein YcgR